MIRYPRWRQSLMIDQTLHSLYKLTTKYGISVREVDLQGILKKIKSPNKVIHVLSSLQG